MRVKNKVEIEGTLAVEVITSTAVGMSALIEDNGNIKKRTLGTMAFESNDSYITGISLSFPPMFNLNTASLDYNNSALVVSLANQLQGTALMAPIDISGTPAFRKIVRKDLDTAEVLFEDSPILDSKVNRSGDTMTGILSAPSYKWFTNSLGPLGVVTEGTALNNITSSFAYGIGTNQNGGLDIMANQNNGAVRVYAGTTNDAPTLTATFSKGDLTVQNRIYSGYISTNIISTYLGSLSPNTIANGHEYKWYNDSWIVGNRIGGASNTTGFSFNLNGIERLRISNDGNLTTQSYGSAYQWDEAYRLGIKKDLASGIENGSDSRPNKVFFEYNWAGTGKLGSVINFSGLSTEGYNVELFGAYSGGNDFQLRSRDGDSNNWNTPRKIWTSGNFTQLSIDSWNKAATESHKHDNLIYLDLVDQNLNTVASPTWNGIQVGTEAGQFRGFKSARPFSFFNGGTSQNIYIGGLLVSDDYEDETLLPPKGIYSKGTIKTELHGDSSQWKQAVDTSLSNITLNGLTFDGTTLKVNTIGKEVFEKTDEGGLRVIDWNSNAENDGAIAIGKGTSASSFNALSFMSGANSSANSAISFGVSANSSGSNGMSFGNYSSNLASTGAVFGYGSVNHQAGCTVLGNFARPLTTTVDNSITNDSTKPVLIVGNGISAMLRSNSHEFYRDGSSKQYGAARYDATTRDDIDFSVPTTLVDVQYLQENGSGGGLTTNPYDTLIDDGDYSGDIIANPILTAQSASQYPVYYMMESNTLNHNTWSPWNNGGLQDAVGLLFGYYIESKNVMLIRGYVRDTTIDINPHNSSSMYIEYVQGPDTYNTINIAYASFVKYRDIRLGNMISGKNNILFFNPK